MKGCPILFLACLALLSGCATLQVPTGGVYPFRAEFTGSAVVQGMDLQFQGALSIVSKDQGLAQIYGPGGLTVFTMDLRNGEARLYNLWGKKIGQYSFPHDQFLGLAAGIPPSSRYLWKRSRNGCRSVSYAWGSILLDEYDLPLELHARSTPPVDAFFSRENGRILLMMIRGSDKVRLLMSVIEGGRWNVGSVFHDTGGKGR